MPESASDSGVICYNAGHFYGGSYRGFLRIEFFRSKIQSAGSLLTRKFATVVHLIKV